MDNDGAAVEPFLTSYERFYHIPLGVSTQVGANIYGAR